ncbi:MAG TPA: flagellar basal body-associated FliL family protein [Gaiellales bacterium]
MKGKLKIILPVLLLLVVGGGGAYFFLLAPKPAKAAPAKITGTLFPLSPEFVVNLADGHYGKVTVALLMTAGVPAVPASGGAATLTEDAAVRAIVTNDLTGLADSALIDRAQRASVEKKILTDLQSSTDVKVTQILFTDVVVQ